MAQQMCIFSLITCSSPISHSRKLNLQHTTPLRKSGSSTDKITTLHKVLSVPLPLLCILPSNNPYICPPIYLALYFNKCMHVTRLNICNMIRWRVVRLKYLGKFFTTWRTYTTIFHIPFMILFHRFKQEYQLKQVRIQGGNWAFLGPI